MITVLAKEESKKAPEVILTSPPVAPNPVTYLGDVGSSTVDLVGSPDFKAMFQGRQPSQTERIADSAPRLISNGTDFHKTYQPPKRVPPLPTKRSPEKRSPIKTYNHSRKDMDTLVKESMTLIDIAEMDRISRERKRRQESNRTEKRGSPGKDCATQVGSDLVSQ